GLEATAAERRAGERGARDARERRPGRAPAGDRPLASRRNSQAGAADPSAISRHDAIRRATRRPAHVAPFGFSDAAGAGRQRGVGSDPQTLAAERAALRALQACAPYEGLAARSWRVDFRADRPERP